MLFLKTCIVPVWYEINIHLFELCGSTGFSLWSCLISARTRSWSDCGRWGAGGKQRSDTCGRQERLQTKPYIHFADGLTTLSFSSSDRAVNAILAMIININRHFKERQTATSMFEKDFHNQTHQILNTIKKLGTFKILAKFYTVSKPGTMCNISIDK